MMSCATVYIPFRAKTSQRDRVRVRVALGECVCVRACAHLLACVALGGRASWTKPSSDCSILDPCLMLKPHSVPHPYPACISPSKTEVSLEYRSTY